LVLSDDSFSDAKVSILPVPSEVLAELDSVKSSHKILPLNVIDNSIQVLPFDIQDMLRNALVEAMFYMEYSQYHTSDKLNTRTEGDMHQIIVLCHGN
jgi:hypothetical protein